MRPVWSHPGTAQEPRRRPQDRPREAQDSPTRPQRLSEAPRHARDRFPSDSGPILEPPGPRKTSKSVVLSTNFEGFRDFAREPSTEAQEAPKGAPREAQMSPRRAPGGPRSGPRAPKTAPRGARSAPRGAQDHPGAPQERTQGAPSRPDASREPFGSPFWPHLGAPGAHFRAS